jgi:hypothetical protein
MKAATQRSQAGSGLLAVLFTMAIVAGLVAVVFSVTSTQVAVTRRTASRAAAVAYADGVMESLYDQWRTAMIGVTNATDRSSGLSNTSLASTLTAPNATTLPVPTGVALSSWSVVAVTPLLAPTTDATGRPTPENGTSSTLRVRIYYLATVNVTFQASSGYRTVTLQRTFVRAGRNLFDNFFFGTQPNIEFHPGPPMYVSGTSYIGGNLFTAHDSLHYTKDVTFIGTHTIDFHPLDSRYGTENPDIDNNGFGDNWSLNNPPHYGAQQKLFDTPMSSLESRFTDHPSSNDTSLDGNNNNDGYREIIEEQQTVTAANPDPLQLDSSTSERLSKNADYRILVDASNNVTIYKGLSTTALSTSNAEYTAIKNSLVLDTAMKDVREGDNVRMVTVDVGKVRTVYNNSTIVDNVGSNDGLLFYIADTSVGTSKSTKIVNSSSGATTSVTSSGKRGVKLTNGASLPGAGAPAGIAKGFSVVTPNPVYIQGDYNTGTTSSSKPPSNTATAYTPPTDNPNPYVSGYDRVPAAVAGDAVNILSNAWNDANSPSAIGSRVGSDTTINTAIIAGNVPTGTDGSYSGGIENFTRFHENWDNQYLTIYGALALLFDSAQATGTWSDASYNPPLRRWYYDTLLQDNNPPGFRVARTYERGSWVAR